MKSSKSKFSKLFSAGYPLKGHSCLNNPASECWKLSAAVCVGVVDLLLDTMHERVKKKSLQSYI